MGMRYGPWHTRPRRCGRRPPRNHANRCREPNCQVLRTCHHHTPPFRYTVTQRHITRLEDLCFADCGLSMGASPPRQAAPDRRVHAQHMVGRHSPYGKGSVPGDALPPSRSVLPHELRVAPLVRSLLDHAAAAATPLAGGAQATEPPYLLFCNASAADLGTNFFL